MNNIDTIIKSINFDQALHYFGFTPLEQTTFSIKYANDIHTFYVFENEEDDNKRSCLDIDTFDEINKTELLYKLTFDLSDQHIKDIITKIKQEQIDINTDIQEPISIDNIVKYALSLQEIQDYNNYLPEIQNKDFLGKTINPYDSKGMLSIPMYVIQKNDKINNFVMFNKNEYKYINSNPSIYSVNYTPEMKEMIITFNPYYSFLFFQENYYLNYHTHFIAYEYDDNISYYLIEEYKKNKIDHLYFLVTKNINEFLQALPFFEVFINSFSKDKKIHFSILNKRKIIASIFFDKNIQSLEMIDFFSTLNNEYFNHFNISPEDHEKKNMYLPYSFEMSKQKTENENILFIYFIPKNENIIIFINQVINLFNCSINFSLIDVNAIDQRDKKEDNFSEVESEDNDTVEDGEIIDDLPY